MDLLVQLANRNIHGTDAVAFTAVHAASSHVKSPGNMEYSILREVGPLGNPHWLHLIKYTEFAGTNTAYVTAGIAPQAAAKLLVPVGTLFFKPQLFQLFNLSKSFCIILYRQLFTNSEVCYYGIGVFTNQ